MIDVFIRTTSDKSHLRAAMFDVSFHRWDLEKTNIKFIHDMEIRSGRVYAEENAESDPYIFTDDDVLIVGKDWVKRAVTAIREYPEYLAVSSLSLVESENLATCPPEYAGMSMILHPGIIYPMHAVGAPMIIRKGTMVDLPEMDLNSECGVIHKMILDRGGKEGLVNGLRHNHLGHGFSSNPALFWGY